MLLSSESSNSFSSRRLEKPELLEELERFILPLLVPLATLLLVIVAPLPFVFG